MFAALAEFERSLIRERTRAGLAAARRLGRTGGRPPKLTNEDIEAAKAMLANPDIVVTQIAHRLEMQKHGRAANPPKPAPPASTAHENARAPPLEGQGASAKVRRVARALTVRLQQAMPLSRQWRTALPTKFYLPLSH